MHSTWHDIVKLAFFTLGTVPVTEGEDCGADGTCKEEEGHEGVGEQEQAKKHERENILSVGREPRWKVQRGKEVVKVSAPVLSESFESVRSWCVFSSVVWLRTLMQIVIRLIMRQSMTYARRTSVLSPPVSQT
jgi:hypothetical protein